MFDLINFIYFITFTFFEIYYLTYTMPNIKVTSDNQSKIK